MRGASQTTPRLLFGILVALGLHACEPRPDSTSVLRRVYIVGTQPALDRDPEMTLSLHQYEQVVDLKAAVVADRRSPPPPCGTRIAALFVKEASERFSVSPLHACSTQETSVYCATTYLPSPYERLFLELSYSYVANEKMKVSVDVMRRGQRGSAGPSVAALSPDDRVWFTRFATNVHLASLCP